MERDHYLDPLAYEDSARLAAQAEANAYSCFDPDAMWSEESDFRKADLVLARTFWHGHDLKELDERLTRHKLIHLERASDRLAERLGEVAYEYPPLAEEISFAGPDGEGVYRYEYRFSIEVATYVDGDSDDIEKDRVPVLEPDPPLKPCPGRATDHAA